MRTTVRLDPELMKAAKQLATRTGRTLTRVIEDALREVLARSGPARPSKPFRMVTFKGRGVQPGVDLDDSASLLDLMEADRPPREGT